MTERTSSVDTDGILIFFILSFALILLIFMGKNGQLGIFKPFPPNTQASVLPTMLGTPALSSYGDSNIIFMPVLFLEKLLDSSSILTSQAPFFIFRELIHSLNSSLTFQGEDKAAYTVPTPSFTLVP